jgi:UPF0716 protein FxsA
MLALVLLICWPIAELLVAVKVAEAIGVLLTVILLLAGWPLGLWLLRAEGRGAWRRLNRSVQTGQAPGREVLNGALILLGAGLLIVPGFITDVLGMLLFLPPTRRLAARGILSNLQSRLVVSAFRAGGDRFGRSRSGGPSSYDVDSTASEVDEPRLPR